jgi:alginate O-acetyltransferase complex protein AlgI
MYVILAISLSLLAILSTRLKNQKVLTAIPYLFFLICPFLTYVGIIGVLTGFDSTYNNGIYFGISFYTVNIAYHLIISRDNIKSNPFNFILSTINPMYLFTGPFPNQIWNKFGRTKLKFFLKRLEIINSELILGVFFSLILAPAFRFFFILKESSEIFDILIFGLIFEIYVYFNFAGFSMIAWSFMRLFGVNVKRNFNQPFSATSIIEYWQRWHITLSNILKELFFKNIKSKVGVYGGVFIVFCASALWHGVSVNFMIWGIVHALFWCGSYFFHKKNFKTLNYLLFFFGVVIGRIIFAENDIHFLLIKIKSLLNASQWKLNLMKSIEFSKIGFSNQANIFISIFLIGLEIILPRFSTSYKNYYFYLRTPIVSILILIYICLSISGINYEPIYGGR